MALPRLEASLEQATLDKQIQGIVIAAANADGSFEYLQSFGTVSLEEDAVPIGPASIFSLASSSKLVTNVAAVQCMEKGLVALDTPIADILPGWRKPKILKGVGSDGKAILEPAQGRITFGQLLTHTSGIASLESASIQRYYAAIGGTSKEDLIERYFTADSLAKQQVLLPQIHNLLGAIPVEPLLFEPGQGWEYGSGQDWAGQAIEKLTGLSLEDYCQQHIFKPLGMLATFRYGLHPEMAKNLVPVMTRKPDATLTETPRIYPSNPQVDMGGSGVCCSTPDFMKLLKSLLRKDGKILNAESIDKLLGHRLPDRTVMESKEVREFFPSVPPEVRVDHSLAGLVNLDSLPATGRSPGSSSWSGATSTYWWIDPVAGVCGFYGSQVMQVRDQGISLRKFEEFERAVYEYCV